MPARCLYGKYSPLRLVRMTGKESQWTTCRGLHIWLWFGYNTSLASICSYTRDIRLKCKSKLSHFESHLRV